MEIYNTFGIPATADRYLVIREAAALEELLSAGQLTAPYLVLGGGSNMVFTKHYSGTIVHLENKGIRLLDEAVSPDDILVEAAAGEVWDDFVHFCIRQGWHGAENLVAIPGTVGAAPVQNVGAYGVEAKDIIYRVRAYEIATGQMRVFTNKECQFAYRNSIFKGALKDRYIIWSVVFCLHKLFQPDLQYRALSEALQDAGVEYPTPQQLADIITEVRWRKLPRPEEMGSAGSFFKNPVVTVDHYEHLKTIYPNLVAYSVPDGYKLAAGWLIERAGWKGRSLGRCGVYEKQALVLVNRGGCTGDEVIALADAVTASVRDLFGVTLEKEAIIVS
ncbi:MAG: UDP-N-acetylmuramate dehydrogenase [Bacteroidales bacterium]|nr:UDP-N-acetylmuramate dehydrogenase [Bacteroidales bacterium]